MIWFIILVETLTLWGYFYFFEFYFLLTLIWFLYYASLMWDGHEQTGFRTWNAFKRLGPFVRYAWADKKMDAKRCLYVVTGSESHVGLMAGFGMDRGHFYKVCYMLPHGMFFVPFLRDVLLWSGAVSNQADILTLLEHNWSVAIPHQGNALDLSIFEYASLKRISVVPVALKNDFHTYNVFESYTKWFGPFFIWPRRQKMRMEVGVPIDAHMYQNAADMKKAFDLMLDLQIHNE